jgi:hypothetical protein
MVNNKQKKLRKKLIFGLVSSKPLKNRIRDPVVQFRGSGSVSRRHGSIKTLILIVMLKVHKRENFFGSDFELFTFLRLVMPDYYLTKLYYLNMLNAKKVQNSKSEPTKSLTLVYL